MRQENGNSFFLIVVIFLAIILIILSYIYFPRRDLTVNYIFQENYLGPVAIIVDTNKKTNVLLINKKGVVDVLIPKNGILFISEVDSNLFGEYHKVIISTQNHLGKIKNAVEDFPLNTVCAYCSNSDMLYSGMMLFYIGEKSKFKEFANESDYSVRNSWLIDNGIMIRRDKK